MLDAPPRTSKSDSNYRVLSLPVSSVHASRNRKKARPFNMIAIYHSSSWHEASACVFKGFISQTPFQGKLMYEEGVSLNFVPSLFGMIDGKRYVSMKLQF